MSAYFEWALLGSAIIFSDKRRECESLFRYKRCTFGGCGRAAKHSLLLIIKRD